MGSPVKRILKNRWLWLLLPMPISIGLLMLFHVPADLALVVLGFLIFVVASIVSSRYVLRAPILVWEGNVEKSAVNVLGWSLVLVSILATQTYRWLFIQADRPDAWTQTYWSSSFLVVMFAGFCFVAYSTVRDVPREPRGKRLGLGGFLVGFLSALGLTLSGILPGLYRMASMALAGLLRAL